MTAATISRDGVARITVSVSFRAGIDTIGWALYNGETQWNEPIAKATRRSALRAVRRLMQTAGYGAIQALSLSMVEDDDTQDLLEDAQARADILFPELAP